MQHASSNPSSFVVWCRRQYVEASLRSKSVSSPDSKQAWKLAVALTSGEWRSLLQPENMEKDASEKSIEIKDTLTDASPFLSHVLQEEKPSFSGLNRAITTASVKAVWAGCVGSCGEKHKELSKTVSIYIYCQRQEEKPAIRSQTRPPIVSIEVCWKFLHKLALTSKRIQASQALRGRDDGQQENVGRPVFDRNQWANGDFFCRVGPSCCGAHLCNKGW